MVKKILGLDLGVTSIGWALIKEENEKPQEIIGMGVRIIPLDNEESDNFTKGNAITTNQKRTEKRTARKLYYRYVLRRKSLTAELKKHNMFNPELFNLPQLTLWELRAKAVSEKIELHELGRVLYHLNQKRGYKHNKSEESSDKKQAEYVVNINNRYQQLKAEGKTIGQKFYEELSKNPHYRTKQQIFPREAYIEEFNLIMKKQQEYYPDILTDEFIKHLRDDIIYYQRPLKSQKGLVSICEFEEFKVKNKDGKEIFTGPKVAHRSNPLFQIAKIWETINNIKIKNRKKQELDIPLEKKKEIFEYLDNNETLSKKELFKILGISEKDGWEANKNIKKGLQGNLTKVAIKNALQNNKEYEKLLQLNLKIQSFNEKTYLIDENTGEIIDELQKEIIDASCINEPLYQLWHCIYSINDFKECKNALIKKFGLDELTAEWLAKIDFSKMSYGNKSVKVLRKILPYLMKGYMYNQAMNLAGYNHSNSLKKEENLSRQLIDKIPLLPKNSLRQPVVEKILNQMIHIVNDIIDEKRGWVTKEEREKGLFEIRIELARELKQSKEERNQTFKNINKIERENKDIEKRLNELGVRATRKNIIKYRLFNEISEDKVNAMCIYTGKMFSLSDALNGDNIDVEHIIPRSLIFDDSQSNKTLTFRWVNQEKGNRTAYDYMASKGKEALEGYIQRVEKLYKDKIISKSKKEKLLMSESEIPQDFIQRQLRETAFISRKAREILNQISKNVWATSGNITEYLRRLWGWDDILMNLQKERIKEFIKDPLAEGVFEIIEYENSEGQIHKKEVIKNWSKRDDHRHHAIDALVIACTKQGFIQRINTLSAKVTRDELYKEVNERNPEFRESLGLLDKYLILQRPFDTETVKNKVKEIIISFKAGKKVATYGKRFIIKNGKRIKVQDHILVPRGPLCEETIYGKIKIIEPNKPIKYLFENPHLIFKSHIKELVEKRLEEYNNDVKKALASLKNNPIYLPNKSEPTPLEYGTCFREEYVVKYEVGIGNGKLFESNFSEVNKIKKITNDIVDKKVKEIIEKHIEKHNWNLKEAFKEPIYFDKERKIPIKSVRVLTGLSVVEVLKYDENGNPIAFAKPGNNHHLAIYQDEKGNKILHLCTFWDAVERKKYGVPVIIDNPSIIWKKILEQPQQYPDKLLKKLPLQDWTLLQSFQQNEIFLLHENKEFLEHIIKNKELISIAKYAYRVQKMSVIGGKQISITFRQIFETIIEDSEFAKKQKKYFLIQSIDALDKLNPIKIRVNKLGEIEAIGIK